MNWTTCIIPMYCLRLMPAWVFSCTVTGVWKCHITSCYPVQLRQDVHWEDETSMFFLKPDKLALITLCCVRFCPLRMVQFKIFTLYFPQRNSLIDTLSSITRTDNTANNRVSIGTLRINFFFSAVIVFHFSPHSSMTPMWQNHFHQSQSLLIAACSH